MTFPHPNVMHLLLAICAGEPLDVDGDNLRVTLPVRNGVEVIPGVLEDYEALEERGWITGDDPPKLTEQGEYALERWMRQVHGKRVIAKTIRMGAFK